MKDETPKQKLIDKIKSVNNILVTVSRNPSVDQLASTLGLTMALNKMGKRSVAVFSGKIPSAIHFLKPEKTFEDNADSLRDFIISLSKDKADRLKVRPEGEFVKVYITPYRTKITPDDLKFSEGDFNIELIIAIGVSSRDELDASIASHGKIFHNAVTATLNLGQLHDALGMISWQDDHSACYAEMCYGLVSGLPNSSQLVDESVATAFLTGVVAATDQFRNSSTTPAVMTLSANLMAKGANQQLITSELESNQEESSQSADSLNGDNSQDRANSNDAVNSYQGVTFTHDEPAPAPVEMAPTVAEAMDSEAIDRRLQQDREVQGNLRGQETLQALQSQLANTEPAVTAPEAPRVDATVALAASNGQAPMPNEDVSVTPFAAPQPAPVAQQPEVPAAQLAPVPPVVAPAPAPELPTPSLQPQYADDSTQISGLTMNNAPAAAPPAPVAEPASAMPAAEPTPSPAMAPAPTEAVSFNQSNQASPFAGVVSSNDVQPTAAAPAATSLSQPTVSIAPTMVMPPSSARTPDMSMPLPQEPVVSAANLFPMPPVPPTPTTPSLAMITPPTASAAPMAPTAVDQPVGQPAVPFAQAPQSPVAPVQPATNNDPSQFVIPS